MHLSMPGRARLVGLVVALIGAGAPMLRAADPPAGRPPMVHALCSPCSVAPGQQVALDAIVSPATTSELSFDWRATAGTLAAPRAARTAWTAPATPGAVPVAVTVTGPAGAMCSDVITIQVVAPKVP